MTAMPDRAPWPRRWLSEAIWRVVALAWLLYLLFPIASLLHSHVGASARGGELALVVVFVAVYVYVMAGPGPLALTPRVAWPLTATLAAVATALCLLPGANWLGLYVFVSAVAGAQRPFVRAASAIVATLALALLMEGHEGSSGFGPGAAGVAIMATEIVAIGLLLAGLMRLVEVNVALQRGREDAARLAVSEERLRFARDLHDLLGHSLAVIVLKSELVDRLAQSDPYRAAQEAREIEAIARTALRDVREAVAGYRHARLAEELEGLKVALRSAGAEVTVDRRADQLADEVDGVLAWAAREAATNILRHSRATRVAVRVERSTSGMVELEVVDNGPSRPGVAHSGKGSGLQGLRERALQLGGVLWTEATPDGGYRVRVAVPEAVPPMGGPAAAGRGTS